MGIFLIVLAILLVIGGIAWLMYGQRPGTARRKLNSQGTREPAPPGGIDKLKSNDLFWGAELTQAGCEVSQRLLGNQYAFDKAPELPMDGCSSAACTCHFRGLKERRNRTRRTHPERREVVRFDVNQPNRRSRASRRRSDRWTNHTY